MPAFCALTLNQSPHNILRHRKVKLVSDALQGLSLGFFLNHLEQCIDPFWIGILFFGDAQCSFQT